MEKDIEPLSTADIGMVIKETYHRAGDFLKEKALDLLFVYQMQLEPAYNTIKTNPAGRGLLYAGAIAAAGTAAGTVIVMQYGCGNPDNKNEPACDDGKDNDGDGHIDWPDDKQCKDIDDNNELVY